MASTMVFLRVCATAAIELKLGKPAKKNNVPKHLVQKRMNVMKCGWYVEGLTALNVNCTDAFVHPL